MKYKVILPVVYEGDSKHNQPDPVEIDADIVEVEGGHLLMFAEKEDHDECIAAFPPGYWSHCVPAKVE